ncbi:MAG: Sir2 family NAD-dependent protein deacetylase, partial [Promethearchaeota archaeon]
KSGFPRNKIAELHGNIGLVVCLECDTKYSKAEVGWNDAIHGKGYRTSKPIPGQPRCPACNGRLISSVVNFGDPLPEKDLSDSILYAKQSCDLFIVLGSSLVVTPAANLPRIAKESGAKLIINNLGDTPLDGIADLLVPYPINDFFPPVVKRVQQILENK